MPPVRARRPAASVASVNRPVPSLIKRRGPSPSVFTSRSRSLSPSTSASTAAMQSRPGSATPARAVTSSKRQPPRLRNRALSLSSPQKNRSQRPSPSTSPAATPAPLRRLRLVMLRSLDRRLVKSRPVSAGGRRVNPVWPAVSTGKGRQRNPSPDCQSPGEDSAKANAPVNVTRTSPRDTAARHRPRASEELARRTVETLSRGPAPGQLEGGGDGGDGGEGGIRTPGTAFDRTTV